MDILTEVAAVMLAGLSFVLAGIGGATARRYHDSRLAFVALGLGFLGVVGVLALLNELSPRYGGPFGISGAPLFLLVVSVALIYVALVRRTPRPPAL